ncbi:enoyl-CoA hydratase-related protein [Rummeliibacillus pycnus]|uniref:enoyl-CoA hydratase-related protein n=1 Tax=Rummeliibacillus pycnus TaxID=101070 RepID=UPI0037CC6911
MSVVLYEVINHTAIVTVNRPDVLNCFNYEVLVRLQEVVDQIAASPDVRIVIFTGAGEKAFSAGADLKERKTLDEQEVKRNVKAIRDVFYSIGNLPQPTIAAVNGHALGGGFEWLLACDFSIASENALLGLTETSWAIIPGAGGTQRLPRLIGEMKAKEMIFTAKKISAIEAVELGIILKAVPVADVLPKSLELAASISKNGPIAIRQAKYAITKGINTDLESALSIETEAYEVVIPTTDRIEALNAFSEKREPIFKGL